MKSPSLAFVVLLVLTVGAKALWNEEPPDDSTAFDRSTTSMLQAAGLAVSNEAHPFGTLHRGSKGACRLIIGEYDPHGTFAEVFQRLSAPVGPLRFAWRGKVSDSAPKLSALLRYYVWRELSRAQIDIPREPIAAWAASPNCDTSRLDWMRIARLD
jgi:hypothetical protein